MDTPCISQLIIWIVCASTVMTFDTSAIETDEGSSIVLDCPLTGPIQWFKSRETSENPQHWTSWNTTGRPHAIIHTNNSLSFRRVELHDEGTYACALTLNSTDRQQITIRVRVQPALFTYGVPKQTNLGDTIYLICAVSRIRGRPRDIYWKSTESGSNVILGRSSYDVIDADYDVYSVLSRWQLTLTDDSLARSLQCVVKTHDNVMLRKDVHLSPCFEGFTVHRHTASLGGETAPMYINTPLGCSRLCEKYNCTSFDFNRCNNKCYYTTNPSYREHEVAQIMGVDQYRRNPESCPSQEVTSEVTLARGARIDASANLRVNPSTAMEGAMIYATCSSGDITPDDIFLQFEDNPEEKLMTKLERISSETGLKLVASLNYTIRRSDEGRSLRCVFVTNGIPTITASATLHACFHSYLSLETRRSPGGTVFAHGVSGLGVCKQKCDADAKCLAFEFNFCERKCYKHSSRKDLAFTDDPLDTYLNVKPVCTPDYPFYEEITEEDPTNYDEIKFIVWASVCALLFLIVVVISVMAYCIYRKYKHPYNYGKSTTAPLKARSTSIRSMVSQNGGPGSTASTTNTYRPPTKRSSRLSLYAEPQGPRYTSGLIPQKSEDSLYSTMPRGNPYSTMPRLYDKRNEDRQSAIF